MKRKVTVAIMVTLFVVGALFTAIPLKAEPETIKIGILGPMLWIQGQGMVEGATLAMEEINDAGGVDVGGVPHTIELVTANTGPGGAEPTEETGTAAMTELMAAGVDFVQGGFRSEAVFGAREIAMNFEVIYQITGSATNELVDCEGMANALLDNPCGSCVRCDYERYKYLFRVTPVNSTMLLKTLAYFYNVFIGTTLLPLYGYVHEGMTVPQVDVAVISEAAVWADVIHLLFTIPELPSPPYKPGLGYKYLLGPYANVTYSARPSPEATSFDSELTGVMDNNCVLLVHIFSAEAGLAFIQQWADWEVPAIPMGIDVLAQEAEHWTRTGGKCEFEATLATSGSGLDITPWMEQFGEDYIARWGHNPIYTSFGSYDAIYGLKEAIERAGTLDPGEGRGDPGVITELENTDREPMTVPHFKFTYNHDVFNNEYGPTWVEGYARAHLVQWQAGRKEVIWSMDKIYSRKVRLPPEMYPLIVDLDYDGFVTIADVSAAAASFGAYPGHARWNFIADVDGDEFITISDVSAIAVRFGDWVETPITWPPGPQLHE